MSENQDLLDRIGKLAGKNTIPVLKYNNQDTQAISTSIKPMRLQDQITHRIAPHYLSNGINTRQAPPATSRLGDHLAWLLTVEVVGVVEESWRILTEIALWY